RLKLREINGRTFELIYYRRKNIKGSRYSDYVIVPLEEPDSMKTVCRDIFGIKAVVRKNRMLYLLKNARIHIDVVKGLGTFVEFEVIVTQGKRQANRLMKLLIAEFGIKKRAVIAGSYIDLVLSK
ncbi:MAG TPA: class IV adenylate cyclase, partial [Bacteroidota bacterium]